MLTYLLQRGWTEDEIILIDMDAGISGAKKIAERPGIRTLFGLIADGKIRAVACQDEDRLCRDVTQIQVNIFLEACKKANVLVITPSMRYDFADPQMGIFHGGSYARDKKRAILHRLIDRIEMEPTGVHGWSLIGVIGGRLLALCCLTAVRVSDGRLRVPNRQLDCERTPFPQFAVHRQGTPMERNNLFGDR